MSDEGRSGWQPRPIRAHERGHLLTLGRLLGTVRRASGLTQAELALYADLHRVQVARIERGMSRTRRSTLERLAAALVVSNPGLGSAHRLADDLVEAAGPALAEESAYAERVARRRAKRSELAWRHDEVADQGRALAAIIDLTTGKNSVWRSDEEAEELADEMWGYFLERRADMRLRHETAANLARRRA